MSQSVFVPNRSSGASLPLPGRPDVPVGTHSQPSVRLSPIARKVTVTSPLLNLNLNPSRRPESEYDTLQDRLMEKLPPSVANFVEHNTGLIYVAVAQLFFALMGTTVKYFISSTEISILMLILIRMLITSIGCTGSLALMRDPNYFLGPPEVRKLLIGRAMAGFIGLFSGYSTLKGLSVSDSVTIQFLTPSGTALLGYIFLREKLTRKELLAGLCSLIGVVLVSRPPFLFGQGNNDMIPPDDVGGIPIPGEGGDVDTPGRMIGVCWALLAVCGSSCAYVLIRAVGNRASPLHSMAYFSYLGTITCSFALIVVPGPIVWATSTRNFLLIMMIGVFGFLAQTLVTIGLQKEKAGRAGLAMYSQLFFALIFEFIMFQTIPPFLSWLGISIILTAASWVALSSQSKPAIETDPESQPISRSPSPIPSSQQTKRGELYSYDAVPKTSDDIGRPEPTRNGATLVGFKRDVVDDQGRLKVDPGLPRRRSSGASGQQSAVSSPLSDRTER